MATYNSAYTGELIDTAVAKINNLVNIIYPVGSIYISTNNVSPATFIGGTWELINDKFLLAGSSGNYPYGSTGGAANVTLTENLIPAHKHTNEGGTYTWLWGAYSGSDSVHFSSANATGGASTNNRVYTRLGVWNKTTNTGGGAAHNNMPPYLSVYMWKRTA